MNKALPTILALAVFLIVLAYALNQPPTDKVQKTSSTNNPPKTPEQTSTSTTQQTPTHLLTSLESPPNTPPESNATSSETPSTLSTNPTTTSSTLSEAPLNSDQVIESSVPESSAERVLCYDVRNPSPSACAKAYCDSGKTCTYQPSGSGCCGAAAACRCS